MGKPYTFNLVSVLFHRIRLVPSSWLLLLLVGWCLSAGALEIQSNQLYQGGVQVQSSDIGLRVTIPENWQGALPTGSSLFFIESADLQATMMLYAESMTNSSLQQTMSRNIPLQAGLDLIPEKAPRKEGELLIADYRVSARPGVRARIYGRTGSNGLSVALITLVQAQHAGDIWRIARDTALKLSFFEPDPLAPAAGSNGSWQDYMQGRYIARFYSGSGYHEKQELWLCSNGEFYTSGDAGGYGGGASGAFVSRSSGKWQAEGNQPGQGVLVLSYNSSERSRHGLSLRNGKLYLNDSQWLRGDNDYCQ